MNNNIYFFVAIAIILIILWLFYKRSGNKANRLNRESFRTDTDLETSYKNLMKILKE